MEEKERKGKNTEVSFQLITHRQEGKYTDHYTNENWCYFCAHKIFINLAPKAFALRTLAHGRAWVRVSAIVKKRFSNQLLSLFRKDYEFFPGTSCNN